MLRLPGLAVVIVAVVGVALGMPSGAHAHPLGNFTINHYTRFTVSASVIDVFAVVDYAEIPAFQEIQRHDADGDGALDAGEARTFALKRAEALADGVVIALDGSRLVLDVIDAMAVAEAGEGGLSTLRLEARFTAAVSTDWAMRRPEIHVENRNDADRLGWREIVIDGGDGVTVVGERVPVADVSRALTSYPKDLMARPLDLRSVSFSVAPGEGVVQPGEPAETHARAIRGNPDGPAARFAGLIARDDLTGASLLLILLAAAGFGALHALSPGHGKTVVAAYLVGSRGTLRHALLLGLTVTATHTSSVYALGFVTLYLSAYVLPEHIYPWLSIASGALIAAMGLALFAGRLRSSGMLPRVAGLATRIRSSGMASLVSDTGALHLRAADGASAATHSAHDGLENASPHRHGAGPLHTHVVPGADGSDVTWRQLLGLGIFGGLLPCPTAIVVMLSAISLHRVGLGLLLIVAFSAGLAFVLTSIGFALVLLRHISPRVPLLAGLTRHRLVSTPLTVTATLIPVVAAGGVAGAGLLITARALAAAGYM